MSVILSELLRVPSTGSLTWFERSSNYTASNLDGIIADTSGGSFTVTLPPTPELGDTVGIIDSKGTFNTNNLIVTSSDNIQGSVNDLTLDIDQASFELVYTGSTLGWQLKTFLPAKVDSVNNSTGDLVSSLVETEVAITAATTLTSTAFGKFHVVSGASDYTVTLPAATGNSGKIIGFRITGTALFTIDGNGSEQIDGELTRVMWLNESAILLCDGSGWTKIGGKSIPMWIELERTSAQSIANASFVKIIYNTSTQNKTGLISSSTFTTPRKSRWNFNWTTTIDAPSVAIRSINALYKNSSLYFTGVTTNATATGSSVSPGNTSVTYTLDKNDTIEFYVNQASGATRNTFPGNRYVSAEITEIPTW